MKHETFEYMVKRGELLLQARRAKNKAKRERKKLKKKRRMPIGGMEIRNV